MSQFHFPRGNAVRRAVLLMETHDGMQHGYEVTHVRQIDIGWDWNSYDTPPWEHWGTIKIDGVLRGLVRMPTDVFEDQPEIEPERKGLCRESDSTTRTHVE